MIRSDSSFQIGTGHVMRCLILGKQLQTYGVEVTFICRDLPGNIFSVIQDKGFKLIKLAYRKEIQQSLGNVSYQTGEIEEKSKKFRRSIYFVKEMQE